MTRGWFLSFHNAILSLSLQFLSLLSPQFVLVIKEKVTFLFSLSWVTRKCYTIAHLQITFMPRPQSCFDYPAGIYKQSGSEGSLIVSALSRALNAGWCSNLALPHQTWPSAVLGLWASRVLSWLRTKKKWRKVCKASGHWPLTSL